MNKKRNSHSSFKGYILEKLIEIILIIFSVYIALTVEGWAEKSHENKRLRHYYNSLISEAIDDSVSIHDIINDAELQVINSRKLMQLVSRDTANNDSILIAFSKLYNASLFGTSSMVSYKSMLASGDMRLIENLEIPKMLVKLDGSYYAIKLDEDLYLNFLTKDLSNFVSRNFDISKSKPINNECYKSIEFKNLISMNMSYNSSRKIRYMESIKIVRQTIQLLKKQLED